MTESALELAALFASAAISASVLPAVSEGALAFLLTQETHPPALLIGVATAGNTLGGMSSWGIGRLLPARAMTKPSAQRALGLMRRFGPLALLMSWLPIFGDGFCVAAGWLRIAWLPALAYIAIGKFARYFVLWWLVELTVL